MYNFSYIMRISLVIQMAHSSLMAFYGKELFVSGYSIAFYKKYSFIMIIAFAMSVLIIYGFNFYIKEKLTINLTTYLILLYTLIISYAASIEGFFARINKNRIILMVSIISSILFCLSILVFVKDDLKSLALCMVIYSFIYLSLMILFAHNEKGNQIEDILL